MISVHNRSNKYKSKGITIFTLVLLFSIFGTMLSKYSEGTASQIVSYVAEILLICFTIWFTLLNSPKIILNKYVLICIIILCVNFALSPYEPRISLLPKFLGYLSCFGYGYSLAKRHNIPKVSNTLLALLILPPALIVFLFDPTDEKKTFFENSNVFVFLGLTMALFYVFLKGYDKKHQIIAWGILVMYMAIGTSLGIIVAVALAYFLINFSWRNLIFLLIGGVVFVLIVEFVDLPVLTRFRDVIEVWKSLSWNDLIHIQDINLHDLGNSVNRVGDRSDTTSSVWRLIQWSGIFTQYVTSPLNIPFGLGADFAFYKTGLPPHNDFLMILSEYGLIVFLIFVKIVIKAFHSVKRQEVRFLVVAIFCYYFTENLINSFPQNVILYFVLGYSLFGSFKVKLYHEDFVDK